MKHKFILTAAALALVSTAALADNGGGALDLTNGTTGFFRTPTGVFTDTWTFTLAGSSFLVNSSTSSAAVGNRNLDYTSVTLRDSADALVKTFSFDPIGRTEIYRLTETPLVAGDYSIVISGVNSPLQASYGANLSVVAAPIPEPETYVLMLAGLGVMGFVMSRRQRS
jgi:hypothetical protein